MEHLYLLKRALNAVNTNTNHAYTGICDNVCIEIHKDANNNNVDIYARRGAIKLLMTLMTQWPKYSGDAQYTVPGPKGEHPSTAYGNNINKWDRSTEYGQLRYELLDYLIDRVDDIVKYHLIHISAVKLRDKILKLKANKKSTYFFAGMCQELRAPVPNSHLVMVFKCWDEYSGNYVYPITGANFAFEKAARKGTFWDKRTEYGKARFRLLDHMINATNEENIWNI